MSRHQAYADGCCDSSLPDAFQPSQEEEGREDGDTYERDIEGNFYSAEFYGKDLAYGKHYTLAGSGDKTCGYFETDAQPYEKDADDAEKPLLKIVCESDSLNQRSAGVDQQSEYNYGGKLQKLKPLISVPQNGNLNQHEKGVDDYGGCADGQAGDTAGDIGKAGNRRGAQGGFDGKCYAEGHDSQSKAQKHTPGR